MKCFNFAAKAHGFVTVAASSLEEATAKVLSGDGEWIESENLPIEIVRPLAVEIIPLDDDLLPASEGDPD